MLNGDSYNFVYGSIHKINVCVDCNNNIYSCKLSTA